MIANGESAWETQTLNPLLIITKKEIPSSMIANLNQFSLSQFMRVTIPLKYASLRFC